MSHRLRILHVSDLHSRVALESMPDARKRLIKGGHAARYRIFQSEEGHFLQTLEQLARECSFDLVCFTGDIADWGLAEEYEAATDGIKSMLKAVRLDLDRLYVVPGNHDIHRPTQHDAWLRVRAFAQQPTQRLALSQWLAGIKHPHNEIPGDRLAVLERSGNFWSWVEHGLGRRELLPAANTHGALGYRHTLDLPRLPFEVHIIGLDSAWLAGGDPEATQLQLTAGQVDMHASTADGRPLDGFRLALVHHPLSHLADEGDAFVLLSRSVDLLLHGHQHETLSESRQDPDQALQILAAGSLYEGDAGDTWVNAFHVIDVTLTDRGHPIRYDVTFFAWAAKNRFWHRASGIYRKAEDGRLSLPARPRSAAPVTRQPSADAVPATQPALLVRLKGFAVWQGLQRSSPTLADRVVRMASAIDTRLLSASDAMPGDRWRNGATPPLMVLQALETLLGDQREALSPPELALAIVVPFVCEAVLAAGMRLLARERNPLDPLASGESDDVPRAWAAWRNYARSEERLGRQRAQLLRRGEPEAADDLAAWHAYQFLHSSGELWDMGSAADSAGSWVAGTMRGLLTDPAGDVEFLSPPRLVRSARLLFASAEDIESAASADAPHRLRDDLKAKGLGQSWPLRERSLAHLLAFVAAMALDARRLDGAAVEHIGSAHGLDATSIAAALQKARWERDGDGTALELSLECMHPAIDLTAQRLVAGLDARRQEICDDLQLAEPFEAVLPQRFSDGAVRAEIDERGYPRYRRPHLLLSLDQVRVMDLLMGQALYGDSRLALRELFQNALDACRLRQARNCYLRGLDDVIGPAPYEGRIVFRVGFEGQRPYVECSDNGIGMAERHLRAYFAKAGRRFTDSHEFHVEKAAWAERGIFCHLNSRFGIGVFGYFMVAEELIVESMRMKPLGEGMEPGILAEIYAGSSLFRIQPARSDITGGTRVRLYLREALDAKGLDDLLDSMLNWLWLPEVDTVLVASNGKRREYRAGQPTDGFKRQIPDFVAVRDSKDANGQPRLYWHVSPVAEPFVLVDGIYTKDSTGLQPQRLVINLNGDLAPELSVNRSEVRAWRKGFEYVNGVIQNGAWADLLDLPKVDLIGLEDAFDRWVLPMVLLDRAWRAGSLPPRRGPTTHEGSRSAIESGTLISVLRDYPLGVAPILDRLILRGSSFRRRGKDNPAPPPPDARLLDSALSPHLARWIAGRTCALARAGVQLGPAFQQLADHAAACGWSDRPSLGLSLMTSGPEDEQPTTDWTDGLALYRGSARLHVSLADAVDLAGMLDDLGVQLPRDVRRVAIPVVVAEDDLDMLRSLASGADGLLGPCPLAKLVYAGREVGLSPERFPAAAQRLVELGVAVTPFARAHAATLNEVSVERFVDLWRQLRRAVADAADVDTAARPLVGPLYVCGHAYLSEGGSIDEFIDACRATQATQTQLEAIRKLLDDGDDLVRWMLSRDYDSTGPWVESLDFVRLAKGALRGSRTILDLAAHLQPLGLLERGLQPSAIGNWALDEAEIDLLRALDQCSEERVVPRGAMLRSIRNYVDTGGTLPRAIELCQSFERIGPACPGAALVTPALVSSPEWSKLLSRDDDDRGPWIGTVDAARVVRTARRLAMPEEDVLWHLQPLGVVEPGLALDPGTVIDEPADASMNERMDEPMEESDAALRDSLRDGSVIGEGGPQGTVSFGALLKAVREYCEAGSPLSRAVELVSGWRDLKIEPRRLVQLDGALVADETLSRMLSVDFDAKPPWSLSVDARRMLLGAAADGRTIGEVFDRLRSLDLLAPDVGTPDPDLRVQVPDENLIDLMRRTVDGHLSLGAMLKHGADTNLALGVVVDRAGLLQRLVGVTAHPVSADQLKTYLGDRHIYLLSKDIDANAPWLEELTFAHVRATADAYGSRLSSFMRSTLALRNYDIHTPEWQLPDAVAARILDKLFDWLAPTQGALHAWELAEFADEEKVSPASLLCQLEVLERLGLNVTDAKDFAGRCAAPASHGGH